MAAYDGAWMAKHLTVVRGNPPTDFHTNCPACGSSDALHHGPATYPDGRIKVKCMSCGATLPSVIEAIAATNGTGPKVRFTRSHDDEQPVVQPAAARRDPRGWLAAKTGVSPEFLDQLPISFSAGWISHEFPGLKVTKDRQAGTVKRRWSPKDAHDPPTWPLDALMPDEALFVEGETDCIALRGIGMTNVYAITSGAPNPPTIEQWAALKARGLQFAVIGFDADRAGREGTDKAVRNALAAGLDVASVMPPGYDPLTGAGKDWCQWVKADGSFETFPDASHDEPAKTVKDVLRAPPTEWRHFGYEAVGGVHMIFGRPKAGKSRTEYARAAAYERSDSFLNVPSNGRTTTFFLTEEGDSTVREKVEAHGIKRAKFLTYSDAKARGWGFAESLAYAIRTCHKEGHGRIVIDTLATWAEVKDLNDTKEMLDAINAVRVACRGLTVVLIYHANKQGGEDGSNILGATGIFAALDVAIEIEKDGVQRNVRVSTRYLDVPEPVATELVDGEIVVVGAPRIRVHKVSAVDQSATVLARLRQGPATVRQMSREGVAGLSTYQLAKYCRELETAGKVTSTVANKQSKEKAGVTQEEIT